MYVLAFGRSDPYSDTVKNKHVVTIVTAVL